MYTITKIGLHHFGGIGDNQKAVSSGLSEQTINLAHKERWPELPSELSGSFIGYNVIIWPNGTVTQYRYVGEETAAATGSNFDTFHICLAGNFSKGVETPTDKQLASLKALLRAALNGSLGAYNIKTKLGTKLDFSISRIFPHRILQPNHTECNGSSLPDNWGSVLAMTPVVIDPGPKEPTPAVAAMTPEEMQEGLSLVQKLLLFLIKLNHYLMSQKLGRELGAFDSSRSDAGIIK